MTYLTVKYIKGNPYLYEVRSVREGDRVRQVFVRYLGRADRADNIERQAVASREQPVSIVPKVAVPTEAVPEVSVPELSRLEAEEAVQELVNELRQVRQQRLDGTISQLEFLTQQRDIAQRVIEVEPLDFAKETWRDILARTEAELAKPPAVEPVVAPTEAVPTEPVVAPEVPVSEGITLYHGTKHGFEEFSESKLGQVTGAPSAKEGFFFTDKREIAEGYASELGSAELDALETDMNRLERKAQRSGLSSDWEKHQEALEKYEHVALSEEEKEFTGDVKEVTLDIKNPLVKDFGGKAFQEGQAVELMVQAKESGYDGVIFKNVADSVNTPIEDMGIRPDREVSNIYAVFDKQQIKGKLVVTPEVTPTEVIPEGTRFTKNILGEITSEWVSLPDRPSVNVARADENLSKGELVARAKAYWTEQDRETEITESLRSKHDKQVYVGQLPSRDVVTELKGRFAYVLGDRKSKGKYQILEAISLEPSVTPQAEVTPPVTEGNLKTIQEMGVSREINALYPELEDLQMKLGTAIDRMGDIQEKGGSGARYAKVRDNTEVELIDLQQKIAKEHPELAYREVATPKAEVTPTPTPEEPERVNPEPTTTKKGANKPPEGIVEPIIRIGTPPTKKEVDRAISDSVERAISASKGKTGIFLSGGVDSTLLLDFVAKEEKPIAFTIATSLEHPDLVKAREVAKKYNLEHYIIIPNKQDIEQARQAIGNRGTLYKGDVAVYLALEEAKKKGIDTILAADGVDEQTGGYWWHANNSDKFANKEEAFKFYWDRLNPDHIEPMLDSANRLGIRVEFPFLDREVVSTLNKIPLNERVKSQVTKVWWKEYARNYVPEHIVSRPKIGFADALDEELIMQGSI